MRDLELHERLATTPDRSLLAPLLELAEQRHHFRVPFLARLIPHATHPDPELRAAIIRCFSGVEGYEGVRTIVRALGDEVKEVRDAAIAALLATGARAQMRLAHGLFHHRGDVRRETITHGSVPGVLAAHLLADEASRDVVIERASQLIQTGDAIEALVQLHEFGVIDPLIARRALLALEWDERTQPLVEGLRIGKLTAAAETREALDAGLSTDAEDRLEKVLDLVGDDPTFVERFVLGAKRRSVQGAQGLRIAWALARTVGTFAEAPPELIALAAIHLPALLAHPVLEVATAKAAARAIPELRPKPERDDPLAAIFGAPVCLDGDLLDLDVIAGVLTLSKVPPIVSIATYGTLPEWEAAIRKNPARGVPLLAQTAPNKHAKTFRELVAALLVTPRADANLAVDVIAHVANVRGELFGIEEAAARDRDLVWLLLETARGKETSGTLAVSSVQRSRLVTWLAARLDDAQVDALLIEVAHRGDASDASLPDEVVGVACRARGEAVADRVAAFAVEHQRAVLMWARRAALFPSSVFFAIVGRLAASRDAGVRALAQVIQEPVSSEVTMTEERTDVRALTDEETAALLSADDEHLFSELVLVYKQPVRGVARALLDRRSAAPSPRVAAAILFAFDDPVLTSRAFSRYIEDDAAFLSKVETEMVDRGRRAPFIPLLAAAWLHRWEIPLASFEREVLAHPEGVAGLLRASLYWPAPLLITQVWWAYARLAAVWRMRNRPRFLAVFEESLGRMVAIQVHLHGAPAARILVEMYLGGVEPDVMERLQHVVVALLDRTTDDTRDVLNRWFDTDVSGARAPASIVAADEALVAEAMRTFDPERLAELAASDQLFVARAALPRIDSPEHLVLRVRAGPVGFGRHVADRLRALADEATLLALLADGAVDPSLRFELGMARLEDDPEVWPHVAAAVCSPSLQRWFTEQDLERIREAGILERRIGIDLATSDQLVAYAEAVHILVDHACDDEVIGGLLAFLEQGTERLTAVRTSAARTLYAWGHRRAFSLALTAALDAWERLAPGMESPAFVALNPRCAEEAAACVVTAGRSGATRRLVDELERMSHLDNQEALLAVLQQAETKEIQERALRALRRTGATEGRLRKLAEVFAWGAKESRLLLGAAFRVHLIGGDAYGYTRLEQRSIYVNPMSFLRGHRDGEGVLRGLIMHELGHHMYHADKPALAIWKQAEREKRHSLLNLVADEHLERNLRARRTEHGDHLKTLAAHAFLHQRRAVDVMELVARLGPHTFAVLVASRIDVARSPVQVEVALGALFKEMERSGTSFVRFVRALRMGLGDRYGDPKVQQALALFDKSFRKSSMQELWEITKKLIEIFGEEARLIDVIDLHDNVNGDGDGEGDARARRGIDDESVQREVDRILDGDKDKPKAHDRTINRGKDESFDEIRDIRRVQPEPESHRDGLRRVARCARRLREVLQQLGLQLEPRRARLKGRTIDRAGLPRAVVRRDPRMLIAREAVQRADLSLSVLIDCSGSMSLDQNLEKAKLFGLLIAEACRGLAGVDAQFWGFSDVSVFDAGTAERCAVSGLTLQGGNNDAGALWHAAQVAMRSTRRAKLLVMISDGSPTECSVAALRGLVRRLERRYGFVCAQVAVRPLDEECFSHHIDLIDDDLDRAVRRFSQVVSRLVRQALAAA